MKDDSFKAYKKARFGDEHEKAAARAEYERFQEREDAPGNEFQGDLVEAKIRKAMSEGAFENLEGQGKPLDLEGYFDAPEHLRLAYHFLKNSGFVPEEVRLSKEVEKLKGRLESAASEEERQEIKKRIAKAAMDYGFHMDYNRKFAKKLF